MMAQKPAFRIAGRFLSLCVILAALLPLFSVTLGGFAIRAVDPFFAFRLHDTDYYEDERSRDVSSLNLGVDRVVYVNGGTAHGGVICLFYRGAHEVGGVGEEGSMYVGLFPGTSHQPGRIISVSHNALSTGVWVIDTSPIPPKHPPRPRIAGMGVVGGLRPVAPTASDRRVMTFAAFLLHNCQLAGLFVVMIAIVCTAAAAVAGLVGLARRVRRRVVRPA